MLSIFFPFFFFFFLSGGLKYTVQFFIHFLKHFDILYLMVPLVINIFFRITLEGLFYIFLVFFWSTFYSYVRIHLFLQNHCLVICYFFHFYVLLFTHRRHNVLYISLELVALFFKTQNLFTYFFTISFRVCIFICAFICNINFILFLFRSVSY